MFCFSETGRRLSKGTGALSCRLFLPISVFLFFLFFFLPCSLLVLELPRVNKDTLLWGIKSGGQGNGTHVVSTTTGFGLRREKEGLWRLELGRDKGAKDGEGGRFRVLHHVQWQLHTEGSKVHVHLQSATLSSRLPARGHLADVWPSPSINPEQLATFQPQRLCF